MPEDDQWDKNSKGSLLVAMLTGFDTAFAPDGSIAALRLTFRQAEGARNELAVQLALTPHQVGDLWDALAKVNVEMKDARLAAKQKAN